MSDPVKSRQGDGVEPASANKQGDREMKKELPSFQGDVLVIPVAKIKGPVEKQRRNGKIILTHSETGHDHTIDAADAIHYEAKDDALTCYLYLEQPADVIHNRSWDTHAPVTLKPGKWMGRRQREYTPEGWRRVAD